MHIKPPSVSVVVAVYNEENYVAQCLDSLLAQKLEDLEIIVVNDGATDKTPGIIETYARQHKSIRLINQENRGLSHARNVGMKLVQGEYVGFVDGDDWVDPSMYLIMRDRAEALSVDLVIANGQLYNDQSGELRPFQDFRVWTSLKAKNERLEFPPREEPDLFMLDTQAGKRLYRRKFLDSLQFQFPPGKIFEDVPTHYKLLLNTNLVVLIDKPFYYYRTHRPGRITARTDKSLFQIFDVMDMVLIDLEEKEADLVIWANYIWFQNWVLRWLRKQIAREYSSDFDQRCFSITQRFKTGSLEVFNEKFKNDRQAIDFVTRQVNNNLEPLYLSAELKQSKETSKDTLHLGNDPEGIFNPDPHTFMPDIWGWICVNFDIKSVLDIGCGMGTNLAWFDEYGFEVLGVEGHPKAVAASRVPGKIVQHDFSKGPWSPEREFDLCICTEFAEHVEAKFEENWMVSVDKCKYLLLAAAPPGQGGYHHVNEQPDEYWIRRFQSRGFIWDSDITNRLRSTCARKPAKWGRNTLMFFYAKDNLQQP